MVREIYYKLLIEYIHVKHLIYQLNDIYIIRTKIHISIITI